MKHSTLWIVLKNLHGLLAIINQLVLLNFLTLSCVDLKWKKIIWIISKFYQQELSSEDVIDLS